MTSKIIQLYQADERGVVLRRVGPLSDAKTALVRREINGEYSLTVSLPRCALYEGQVQIGSAIRAAVNEAGKEQIFIVKRRSRSLTGDMVIYAEHQSYLFNGLVVHAGSINTGGYVYIVFSHLRSDAVPSITDISTWTYSRDDNLRVDFPLRPAPLPMMTLLKNFLIAHAGGELIFDGFDVEYVDAMGTNKGAFYRYAANMTDMSAEDIMDNYVTGIYPYWGAKDDVNRPLTVLTNELYQFTGNFPVQVAVPVDFSNQFSTAPTQQQLLDACQAYEALHSPTGIPISIKASRVRVKGDVDIDLGDTVRVINTPWGVDVTTRVFALTFDALQGRVVDVQFGTVNPGFAGAVRNIR